MNGLQESQKSMSVQNAIVLTGTEKKCTKCGETKPLDDFHVCKREKDGRYSRCKSCHNSDIYNSYHKDPERYRATSRRWTKNHPDKKRQNCYSWNERNPEKVRAIYKKFYTKAAKKPSWKIHMGVSRSIRMCFRYRSGYKNGRSWEFLVGYTKEQLKEHLEKQFQPGMTWDNWGNGGWHIDHIVPVSAFNFEKPEDEDFKRCWSLKNLRPLWAKENIRKSNKLNKHFQPKLIFK